jgi:hypothetical protein
MHLGTWEAGHLSGITTQAYADEGEEDAGGQTDRTATACNVERHVSSSGRLLSSIRKLLSPRFKWVLRFHY